MLLHKYCDLPGAILSQPVKQTMVTSRGKEIYREEEIGASLSIPRNSVDSDVEIGLAACFSDSYQVPEDMESVSPAYVVTTNKKVGFRKDMTVRMQHTANVESDGDSDDDMVLMEAPTRNVGVLKKSEKKVMTSVHKKHYGIVKVTELEVPTVYRLTKTKRERKGI